MSKADVLELAEQIQKTSDSPRYIQTPISNPRPRVGPLSENFDPSKDDQGNSLYEEIPFEGLYLTAKVMNYIDSSPLNLPELTKRSPIKNKENTLKMESEYEIEDEYA